MEIIKSTAPGQRNIVYESIEAIDADIMHLVTCIKCGKRKFPKDFYSRKSRKNNGQRILYKYCKVCHCAKYRHRAKKISNFYEVDDDDNGGETDNDEERVEYRAPKRIRTKPPKNDDASPSTSHIEQKNNEYAEALNASVFQTIGDLFDKEMSKRTHDTEFENLLFEKLDKLARENANIVAIITGEVYEKINMLANALRINSVADEQQRLKISQIHIMQTTLQNMIEKISEVPIQYSQKKDLTIVAKDDEVAEKIQTISATVASLQTKLDVIANLLKGVGANSTATLQAVRSSDSLSKVILKLVDNGDKPN